MRDTDGSFVTGVALELSALDANGQTRSVPVNQTGPGLFEANVGKITYGQDQQFSWRLSDTNHEDQTASYGFVYSFSPEFQTLGIANDLLSQIQDRAAGKQMTVGQSNLIRQEAAGTHRLHLWPYLLCAALLLIPFDILCRRLG